MLFASRHRPDFFQRSRSFVLPRTGYGRAFRYRLQRIARMTGSPHFLAGGVAIGTALALTPWFGVHMFLGFALARLVRVSVPLTLAFTLLNNPWTLPFVMIASYQLGRALLGGSLSHLPSIDSLSWSYLLSDGVGLLTPLAAGSTILAVSAFCLIYWPLRRKLTKMRSERLAKLQARKTALLALQPEPAAA